jgi:hypothetical protein
VYLVGSTISNNYTGYLPLINFGGANGGNLFMWNNRIIGNRDKWDYVFILRGNFVSINDIFSGNTNDTGQGGGAIYLNRGNATIVNAIFAFNSAGEAGGAIRSEASDLRISNTIFYQNGAPIDPDISDPYEGTYGTIEISHSMSDHPFPSHIIDRGGLLFGDPGFVDADGADDIPGTLDDDYRLLQTSPAIDAGATDSLLVDFLDIDGDNDTMESWPEDASGNMRVFDGGSGIAAVDMGVFEFGAPPVETAVFYSPETTSRPEIGPIIYPNPASSRFTLMWNHSTVIGAELNIYDVAGRFIGQIRKGSLHAMERIEVSIATLPTGLYFIRESHSRISGRLIVIH